MTTPNEGFIKLSRKFFENKFWSEERSFSLAEAWLDLVQMARFDVAPQEIVIKMKTITIHRGELRASQRYLSQRWKWSVGKVNRFLKILEDERSLERRNEHSETIIKLCKYDTYNPINNLYLNDEMNANGTLAEHRQIQIKERKERKENIPPNPPRGIEQDDFSEDKVQTAKSETPSADKIDFDKLLNFINQKTGRDFRKINEGVRKKFMARIKEGYAKTDILNAISNAVQDSFHKESNFQYLTPEYFSRANTLDKHGSKKTDKPKKTKQDGVWYV